MRTLSPTLAIPLTATDSRHSAGSLLPSMTGAWLMRTTDRAVVLWDKAIGEPGDWAGGVVALTGGDAAVAITMEKLNKAGVLRVDAAGTVLWQTTQAHGLAGTHSAYGVVLAGNALVALVNAKGTTTDFDVHLAAYAAQEALEKVGVAVEFTLSPR